jgi:hypothetical protein
MEMKSGIWMGRFVFFGGILIFAASLYGLSLPIDAMSLGWFSKFFLAATAVTSLLMIWMGADTPRGPEGV